MFSAASFFLICASSAGEGPGAVLAGEASFRFAGPGAWAAAAGAWACSGTRRLMAGRGAWEGPWAGGMTRRAFGVCASPAGEGAGAVLAGEAGFLFAGPGTCAGAAALKAWAGCGPPRLMAGRGAWEGPRAEGMT